MRWAARRCTSASPRPLLHPVQVVGVVGNDYPHGRAGAPGARGIDWSGVERAEGESFRWKGKYSYDLQSRETLETRLGVFANFQPKLPASARDCHYVFLGNIDPELQLDVLEQIRAARAGRLRYHELLDPEQEGRAAAPAAPGGHPHGERRRSARALGRLEHPPRGTVDPAARPQAGGHQAGRVRAP